jgi:hypothetical protein
MLLACGSEGGLDILGSSSAVTLISLNACGLPGVVAFPRTATWESLGTISFRSSSCFRLSPEQGLPIQ